MDETISIVVCSTKSAEENEKFIKNIEETTECTCHVFYLVNMEGVGLTKIYGDFIKSTEIQNKDDIVVFIHADIEFLKRGWDREIIRLFNENKDYGIIGVAGSAQFDQKGAWWNYEKKYGQVLHRSEGKSWLTAFSPLLKKDLEEVCVIDGLFMAVHTKRISKDFDESIKGFDFYDIDFCLANFIDKKTKIGVTTNIRVAHNSVGKLKPTWYENRDLINEKYKNYLPINLKK